jgi:hypothetical protein
MSRFFSWSRWAGVLGKEFIQLKRDRLTFAMIVGIPVIQLVLFGFAINRPKISPAAVRDADGSEPRAASSRPKNSDYLDFARKRTATPRSTGCSRPAPCRRGDGARGPARWSAASGRRS